MISLTRKDRRKDKSRAKEGNRRGGFFSYLIEPYFQVRLGALILIINLLFGFLISGVVYYYVVDIHDTVRLYFEFTHEEAAQSWRKFFLPLAICLSLVAVFFMLTFFVIIRYTHQIYGPLVSIHNFIDSLLAQKASSKALKPLHLRSSDQLVSLAHKLNLLAEKYSQACGSKLADTPSKKKTSKQSPKKKKP